VAEQTDKLIRADYLLSTDSLIGPMREALLEVLKSWKQTQQPGSRIVAKVVGNRWASVRAA
jgi:hypothetical protein